MSRIITFFIFCFFCQCVLAQTFSLITDPILGEETNFHNNLAADIALSGDRVVLSGQHVCHPLTPTSNGILCGSLSSFDLHGNLLNAILLDSFFNASEGGLLTVENRVFIANFKQSSLSNKKDVYIQEFNQNLELVNQTIVPTLPNSVPNNDGINFIDNHFYVYGDIVVDEGTRSKGFIQKLDSNLNLLWDKQYAHEKTINGCDLLQSTNDGGLVFIHEYSRESTVSSNRGMQIVKLDSTGIKLDSLEIDREGRTGLALISDNEGMIYFHTASHPTDDSIFEQSSGRINKYSTDLDELIWSTKFPFNNFTDKRSYNIFNIIEARNGDIIACGSAFDEGPDGPLATPENHLFNAFLTRLSKDGDIKWMHFYKPSNENALLPTEEFGDFHASVLANLVELEDGRIIAAGSAALTSAQSLPFIGSGEPLSQFLILAVDGVTGCIAGEECDEVIVLDNKYRPRDKFLPVLYSDYTWIVERADTNELSYTYSSDSILDDTNHYFERIDLETIDNPVPTVIGLFREIGGRIYQKFDGDFNEKLVFDIHLQVGESIKVYRGEDDSIELQAIASDTIILLDGIPRKQILLQCLSEPMSNDTIVWIEGIGELDNSKFCGFEGQESRILCVQDNMGNSIYSLNESACQVSIDMCQNNTFEIGDVWTYEDFVLFNNNNSQEIRPFIFEIVDERIWEGRLAYVIEPGIPFDFEYMIYEEGRVYYWDELLGEYQLTYDFKNDSIYYVRYFDFIENNIDSTAVFIDSVRVEQFEGKSIQVQYCRSQFGNGNSFQEFKVYEGIGRGDRGLKFQINLVDGFVAGDLRCFHSEECDLNFEGVPCDTIIDISTSIFENLESSLDINLYPNPIQDKLYLDVIGLEWDYQIFNLQGQQMSFGAYNNYINVSQLAPGIYFLQLRNGEKIYQALKFIKS